MKKKGTAFMQQLLESNERHDKILEESAERDKKADARDE